jgi:hypothetical protein
VRNEGPGFLGRWIAEQPDLDDSNGVVGTAPVMQRDDLILYNRDGERRAIPPRAGRLSIITGDSRPGSPD